MPRTQKSIPYRNAAQFGREVRAARKHLGLTQIELAQRAKVGSKFLYELEHGKDTLRMDKVFDVLEVLSIQVILFPFSTRR